MGPSDTALLPAGTMTSAVAEGSWRCEAVFSSQAPALPASPASCSHRERPLKHQHPCCAAAHWPLHSAEQLPAQCHQQGISPRNSFPQHAQWVPRYSPSRDWALPIPKTANFQLSLVSWQLYYPGSGGCASPQGLDLRCRKKGSLFLGLWALGLVDIY